MADRVIFHCDLNCFFASVELLDKPALREVPVAVCGDPASRHGIILAKNEPAKRRGVQTAETVWQAKQKCPEPDPAAAPPRTVRASTPAVSTPSMGSIPIWWSPSASMRAGWTSPAACTCSATTPDSWRMTSAPACGRRWGSPSPWACQLQQGVRQAGQRLQKARRHHRYFAGELAGHRVAPAGGGPAVRGPRRPAHIGAVRRGDHRPAGRLQAGDAGAASWARWASSSTATPTGWTMRRCARSISGSR